MKFISSCTFKISKEVQSQKVNLFIFVTEWGIVKVFKEQQPSNAYSSISLTDSGILISDNDLHS